MALIKVINSKASLNKAIDYVTKDGKTEERLISGKDCTPETAKEEMKVTKELWGKTQGRQYKHYVQSFNPKDNVTPEKAHELGKKFIDKTDKFKGHEVLISTHKDKDHVHNHIIVNSVNFNNGLKYQESKKELEQLKQLSNEISREHGLSIPVKGKSITSFNQKKYKVLEKSTEGDYPSYFAQLSRDINKTLKTATNKEEFIDSMEKKGYKVKWIENNKNITFITPEGKKIRGSNLNKTLKDDKFTKEGIKNELKRNFERRRNRATRNTPNVDWSAIRHNVEGEGNRVSEFSSNGITREIQSKVRGIKERTDYATGKVQSKDKSNHESQRDTKPKYEKSDREPKPKIRERDIELER